MLFIVHVEQQQTWSPPSWWSGLKLNPYKVLLQVYAVSTLVVEWIEIPNEIKAEVKIHVSTLVVEWIEISIDRI